MSDLVELARRSGMHDPADAPVFADAALATPEEQLADLRKRKPHLWPRSVKGLSSADYRAARAEAVKPRRLPVGAVAGGADVRSLPESEYRRIKAGARLHQPSLMRGSR